MTIKEKIAKKQERLDMYYKAETAILGGAQSYSMGTRSLTRANLSEIENMITTLENKIQELENISEGKRSRKAFSVIPCDF